MDWRASFDRDGYSMIRGAVDLAAVLALIHAVDEAGAAGRSRHGSVYAIRNLLETVPAVNEFVNQPACRRLIEPILGPRNFPVRSLLFEKSPDANWGVPWHQDSTIAVRERRDVEGYGSWTVKEGVPHVQPPASVLEGMLTLRLHLDPCGLDNGALRALPGSHRHGRLTGAEIDKLRAHRREVDLPAEQGDVLLLRPLLVHASNSAAAPRHRRIVHIEFAADPLPGGLEWHSPSAAVG